MSTPDSPSGDGDIVIACIPKNQREFLKVSLSDFRGYRRIRLQLWARSDGKEIPTRKSFSLSTDACNQLVAALNAALNAAAERWPEDASR